MTTLPIDNKEDIQEIIDAYKVRWIIELYFRILKSGMGIEKLQYQTLPRYLNAVMPLMIVAWRVQMITQAARQNPHDSCEDYFDQHQWQPLYLVTHPDQPLPDHAPAIAECLLMVAMMGGYINKKSQGRTPRRSHPRTSPPGPGGSSGCSCMADRAMSTCSIPSRT